MIARWPKMMGLRRRSPTAGFTLVELMAVLAIAAVLAAFIVPSAIALNDQADERNEIRRVLNELRLARAAALTRSPLTAGSNVPTVNAGITIVNATSYVRFSDGDSAPGGEVAQRVVDLTDSGLTITAPLPGSQIRFRSNGTRLNGSPVNLLFLSPSGRTLTINVALTGLATLE